MPSLQMRMLSVKSGSGEKSSGMECSVVFDNVEGVKMDVSSGSGVHIQSRIEVYNSSKFVIHEHK